MTLRNSTDILPFAILLAIGLGVPASGVAAPAPPAIAKIAQAALPAVVDIESIDPMKPKHGKVAPAKPGGMFKKTATDHADMRSLIVPPRAEQALGTGFLISPKGYIVTNHHVVAGASQIKVTLHDGRIYTAKLVGADKKADLAVLKIDAKRKLPSLTFGDSSRLGLGDWVVAVGNPFGLGFSVSAGVVSALHRDIGSGPFDNFIQTDAAINRGNSGGPMLDAQGHVVGVDSAIYSPSGGSVGIGFAIPSSMVAPVAQALIAHGRMSRGWAGIRVEHLSADMKAAWHMKTRGVVIGGVVQGGPSAGKLAPADVITAVNDHPVDTVHAFKVAVAEVPAGQTAKLRYSIDGSAHIATIVIAPRPSHAGKAPVPAKLPPMRTAPKPNIIAALGIGVMTHPGARGVIVVSVARNSPASRAGLHKDTLIEAVGPHFITTPQALRHELTAKHSAALLVDGPGGTSWVSVPLDHPARKAP